MDLEPALLGDELAGEPVDDGFVSAVWRHDAAPFALCGTTIPGNVRLQVGPLPPDDELPILDLSWRPEDPTSVLDAILTDLGLEPGPPPLSRTEFVAALRDALGYPPEPAVPDWPVTDNDTPTQELRAITEEEQ